MVELTREHMSLVHAIRWTHFREVPESVGDELVSAGMLALVMAAPRYNADKQASFRSFAYARILGAMKDEQRTNGRSRRSNYNGTVDTRPALPAHDWVVDRASLAAADPIGDWELTETLHAAIDTLPPQQQIVIRLHYLQDWRADDVGELLNVSESRISMIGTQARATLRSLLDLEALAA